jgi:transposase InsO family protein
MDDSQTTSLEQIRALVDAHDAVRFTGQRREEVYEWVEKTLVRHEYAGQRKPDKGVLRRYVAQMTGLRNTSAYRKRNASYQPTRPTPTPIGERRKPRPQGVPGYLRIDTVHQGDQDGRKGLYHINAVDEVTQWEIVAATPQISELWLLPVLEAMLQQFPFVIRGFHSDNGSEFINYTVARLLGKLLIEQTRSRPHQSGDNGLVEAKNGAIIRKHIGYGYISAQHAQAMDQFYREHLNPYVNFHRPCAVPKVITAANGKRRRLYQRWATPFELLRESPDGESCLRPGISLAELERFARSQSDTEAALAMQQAKRKLLGHVKAKQTA